MEKICPKCQRKFHDKDATNCRARTFCSRDCANKTTMNGLKLKGISRDTSHLREYQFKKGVSTWNKGLNYKLPKYYISDEERKRRAENMSKLFRGKPRPDKRGANSHFWKGGISKERDRIYQSAEYREWRRQVFERDNYTCQLCGARNGNGQRVYLEADHIKPFSTHIYLRFEVANGRTLCKPCHRGTDTYGGRMHKRKDIYIIKNIGKSGNERSVQEERV